MRKIVVRTGGKRVVQTALHEQLRSLARDVCLPFLLSEERFRQHADQITFMLIGSVAPGLCTDDSDVDIALVCDEEDYRQILHGVSWAVGKPSEASVAGVQLHYFGVSIQSIAATNSMMFAFTSMAMRSFCERASRSMLGRSSICWGIERNSEDNVRRASLTCYSADSAHFVSVWNLKILSLYVG